jgi:hypothetical protein
LINSGLAHIWFLNEVSYTGAFQNYDIQTGTQFIKASVMILLKKAGEFYYIHQFAA